MGPRGRAPVTRYPSQRRSCSPGSFTRDRAGPAGADTSREPDPASTACSSERWWPDRASGTVLVAPGRRPRPLPRLWPRRPHRADPGGLRHGLRPDVDDEAVHGGGGREAGERRAAAARRPDLPPRYLGPVPAGQRPITVRHLLAHQAGPCRRRSATTTRRSRAIAWSGAALERAVRRRTGRRLPLLERRLQPAGGDRRAGFGDELRALPRARAVRPGLDAQLRVCRCRAGAERGSRSNTTCVAARNGRPYDHPWMSDGPSWNLRAATAACCRRRATTPALAPCAARRADPRTAPPSVKLFAPRNPLGIPGYDAFREAYGWTVGPASTAAVSRPTAAATAGPTA